MYKKFPWVWLGVCSVFVSQNAWSDERDDSVAWAIEVSVVIVEAKLSEAAPHGFDIVNAAIPEHEIGAEHLLETVDMAKVLEQLVECPVTTVISNSVVFSDAKSGEAKIAVGAGEEKDGELVSGERTTIDLVTSGTPGGAVTLSISYYLERVVTTDSGDSLSKQNLDSNVTVAPGAIAILGGLIQERDEQRFEALLLVQTQWRKVQEKGK